MINPVVLGPTYNNAGTLIGVLDRIHALGLPMVIVNDGSTDATAELLAAWLQRHQGYTGIHVLTHAVNRGKAAALLSGFKFAAGLGYTHAITVDTDGQLDPAEIPTFIEASRQYPEALVLGFRDDRAADYPAKSRIGRSLSNFAIHIECGESVQDSQCGLRVYPLELVQTIRCRTGRFGYETEIITRAVWAGCPIVELPVRCRYFQDERRVTHFKVVRDTLRHIALHASMVARAMMPWPHRQLYMPHVQTGTEGDRRMLRRYLAWASPRQLWKQIRSEPQERIAIAVAVAIGVFVSNLPIYGFQLLLCLYLSRRLHLNPVAMVLGSFFSTPPIGPVIIIADVILGHLLLFGSFLNVHDFDFARIGVAATAWRTILEWTLGSFISGTILAILAFLAVIVLLRLFAVRIGTEQ